SRPCALSWRPLFRAGAIVLLFGALVAVNLRGVHSGTQVAAGAAILKFLALLLFVALGATLVRPEHLALQHPPSVSSLLRGAILAVFALPGLEIAVLLALPGTFASLVFVASVSNMLLYAACCAGAWELERKARSLGDTAQPGRSGVIPLLAMLGLLGVLCYSTLRELLAVGAVLVVASILYWMTSAGRR